MSRIFTALSYKVWIDLQPLSTFITLPGISIPIKATSASKAVSQLAKTAGLLTLKWVIEIDA